MKSYRLLRQRRLLRLRTYDYSAPGAYFITVCVQNRECMFGEIVDGSMNLNHAGLIVQETWNALPEHYPHAQLDAFIIMPNHLHGIIILNSKDEDSGNVSKVNFVNNSSAPHFRRGGFQTRPSPDVKPQHGLSEIVRALKTFSSRRINAYRQSPGARLWQRGYYEHIIRNETDLIQIRDYILNNPSRWETDSLFFGQLSREI
ncbi:MAG: transposase [bacterium]